MLQTLPDELCSRHAACAAGEEHGFHVGCLFFESGLEEAEDDTAQSGNAEVAGRSVEVSVEFIGSVACILVLEYGVLLNLIVNRFFIRWRRSLIRDLLFPE